MDYETLHSEGMKELLAHPDPVQRGKGIFMKHGVVSGFRAGFREGLDMGIDVPEIKMAGIQILATLLLTLSGSNPAVRILVYKTFVEVFLELNEILEKPDVDPE